MVSPPKRVGANSTRGSVPATAERARQTPDQGGWTNEESSVGCRDRGDRVDARRVRQQVGQQDEDGVSPVNREGASWCQRSERSQHRRAGVPAGGRNGQ